MSQARSNATREAALDAAAVVFERKGYAASTVADMLKEGDLSRGAVYFHWSSKEEIAREILATEWTWMGTLQVDPDNPLQTAIDATYALVDSLAGDVRLRASVRLTIETATFAPDFDHGSYRQWADLATDVLTRAQQAGQLREGLHPSDAAAFITSAMIGIQITATALENRRDMRRRVHVFWQLTLPGMAASATLSTLRIRPTRRRTNRQP